jgi:ABC-2 type transport system permease protein
MSVHTIPSVTPQLEQPPGNAAGAGMINRGRVGALLRGEVADRRLAWSLALFATVGYGLLAGWWTPRGPMSTLEGLSAMGLGLIVGCVAGLLLRTRWAMLVAPLTFAMVFELARLAVSGPTVDGIHLTSTYGIMAFTVGRGVVMFGTDMDGSQAFIATAADQQSLMAFAFNAMLGTGLFGAIAVAREYGHNTVVPTYLTSPRRTRAGLLELTAVLLGGALLGLVGQGLIVAGVALALPSTEYGFLVSTGGVTQILAATTLAGAVGAVLGAGLGAVIRNLGGAVTAVVLALFMIPPLVVQLVNDAASWIPPALAAVISGVSTDVNTWAALTALLAWGVVPAAAGLFSVQRRDVV